MGTGIVYLVGAGPGDSGLITVRGVKCIKKADVLVYDRLASGKLLSYASPQAERIYVGKSPERHALSQEEINKLLVKKALEGKIVTRLKGGDPFLFGRGGEEAEFLVGHGLSFEVVPGVTSAISVPAYAGIPVTHRHYTSAVSIITGNEDPLKQDSQIAWDKISTGAGTLVFLMGMRNLPGICTRLIENGRPPETPVALIRWGTHPEQKTLTGTLETIEELAAQSHFTNPAVIVVGEVVNLRSQLSWRERKPFFGKRALITRTREQASALSAAIEELGGESWEFPTICIVPPEDYKPLDGAIHNISDYQWLIFTSVNGVKSFFERLNILHKDIRALYPVKICAIGPKTEEALRLRGLHSDYIPDLFKAEDIVKGLSDKITAGDRILLPRADIARSLLPEALMEMGAQVDQVTAYKTLNVEEDAAPVIKALTEGFIHVLTFTSSSTVRNFIQLVGKETIPLWIDKVTVASIGPITTDTARELGLRVDVEAKEYTIEGLVNALAACFEERRVKI